MLLICVCIVLVFVSDYEVSSKSKTYVYSDVNNVPKSKVGVLLGTSKYLSSGKLNEYWVNRIDATINLYKFEKINNIIISGDNSTNDYDEPTQMKKELVKNGIPDSAIYLDYAGFRTYDSMIRAYKIFGQKSFTVISQKFHNERAIYIAQHYGIAAIGFNAKDVNTYNGFKTMLREKFARVKLFIDLLTNKEPKFLGEKILIK